VAYAKGAVSLTWAQVDLRAATLASILAARKVGFADHVAIIGANDPTWVCAEFALWRIGAVPVLLHGGLPVGTLMRQLAQAEVKAVIAGPEVSDSLLQSCLDSGMLVFVWGGAEAPAGVVDVDTEHADAEVSFAEVTPDDIAMIAYSSGTTGDPKGTVIRYRHIAARLQSVSAALELTSDDIGMVIGPLFMGGTQNLSVLPYAAAGITCVMAVSGDPADVLRGMDLWGVTTFFAVPTLLTKLLAARGGDATGKSLRRVMSAGAPLPQSLYRAFAHAFEAGVYEICGTFETGGGLAITERERQAGKATSIGRPMLGYLVGVINEIGEQVSTPNVRGELTYGGPAVACEYFGRRLPEESVAPDGLFRSGDVGYFDKDGYYYIVDRIKDVIKSGGQNVYPAEIEAALLRMDEIRECAVIGVPHEKWGEAVHAVVVVPPGAGLTGDSVIEFGRRHLAGYQVPKSVEFVDELPKTSVGKVAKRDLRDRFSTAHAADGVTL
jgi:fatty-acyl-CoA synthase